MEEVVEEAKVEQQEEEPVKPPTGLETYSREALQSLIAAFEKQVSEMENAVEEASE